MSASQGENYMILGPQANFLKNGSFSFQEYAFSLREVRKIFPHPSATGGGGGDEGMYR